MEVITGYTTEENFVKAINDKGANITNTSTPEELKDAINTTGGDITFKSTNEAVIESVNSEIPEPTIVPWTLETVSDKIIFKSNVHFDKDDELYNKVLGGLDPNHKAKVVDEGLNNCGEIYSESTSTSDLDINISITFSENDSIHLYYSNVDAAEVVDWEMYDGTYTVDGVEHEIVGDEIIDLIKKVRIVPYDSDSNDYTLWIYRFINTISE